jgi:hypothetical protein
VTKNPWSESWLSWSLTLDSSLWVCHHFMYTQTYPNSVFRAHWGNWLMCFVLWAVSQISVYTHLLLLNNEGHQVFWRWYLEQFTPLYYTTQIHLSLIWLIISFVDRINVFVTLGLWGVELMIGKEEGQHFFFSHRTSRLQISCHFDVWLIAIHSPIFLMILTQETMIVLWLD